MSIFFSVLSGHFLSVRKLSKWMSVWLLNTSVACIVKWLWLVELVYLVSKLIKYGTQIDLNCWVWKGGHSCYYFVPKATFVWSWVSKPSDNSIILDTILGRINLVPICRTLLGLCWIHYMILKDQCNLLNRLWASGLKLVQRNNFLSMQSAIWP